MLWTVAIGVGLLVYVLLTTWVATASSAAIPDRPVTLAHHD